MCKVRQLGKFESFIDEEKRRVKSQTKTLIVARESQDQEFSQKEKLESLRRDKREVMAELRLMQKNKN